MLVEYCTHVQIWKGVHILYRVTDLTISPITHFIHTYSDTNQHKGQAGPETYLVLSSVGDQPPKARLIPADHCHQHQVNADSKHCYFIKIFRTDVNILIAMFEMQHTHAPAKTDTNTQTQSTPD